jgi:hypothetical protein
MARFAFALGVEGEVREAGVVQCDSFDDALVELSRRYRPKKGDTLTIGVAGFPPARYEHTGYARGVKGWRPTGLMAA